MKRGEKLASNFWIRGDFVDAWMVREDPAGRPENVKGLHYIYIYIHISVCVPIFTYTYIYIYIHIHIYIYMYMINMAIYRANNGIMIILASFD